MEEPQAIPVPPTPPIPTPTMPDSYDQSAPMSPTVNTPVPSTPEPIQPPDSKISRKLLIPSIILLIVAVILVTFKLILKNKVVPPPQPTPTASTQPTPSPTPDPTANWKTYTNLNYGFSVKYNPTFSPNDIVGTSQQLALISFGSMKNNGFDIEISTGDKLDYYKNRITENIDKEEKVTVGGVVGTKLTYKQVIVIDKFDVSQVIINKNDRDYIITALAPDIDHILSTFKFLDQSNAEGKFCGGIAANLPENQCPEGFYCKLDGNHPDAGGVCIKN